MPGIIPAPPLSRANLTWSLERGIRKVFYSNYELRTGEWEKLFNIEGSDKHNERDVVFAGLNQLMPKEEGAEPDWDSGAEAYSRLYTHLTFALGFKITREAMEDELYGVARRYARELAIAATYTREIQAMAPFNNSSATQYTVGSTNYPLLSASHFRADGGTWSNLLASGADLTPESLELALTQMRQGTLDMRGRKQRVRAKWLMVGASDEYIAKRIVNSTHRAMSADNDVNVLRDEGLEVFVATHLTDDGRWYLIADPADTSLTWFNRRPVTMDRETDGTGSGNYITVASYRASSGVTGPTGIFGSL